LKGLLRTQTLTKSSTNLPVRKKSTINNAEILAAHKDVGDAKYGQGWRRIWHYFDPKIFGILMPFFAAIASIVWPILGLVVSKV
jgi:hypothetical protein